MSNPTTDLADRYVALWNEPDAAVRRRRIEALWTPAGATTNRLLDARGWDAIDARVTTAYESWVRDKDHAFRRRGEPLAHHGVVRLEWEMGPRAGGPPVSRGTNVLLLAADGRIVSDYQFAIPGTPASADRHAIAERYVAFWNEPDPRTRRARIDALWSEDAAYVGPASTRHGRAAIALEASDAYDAFVAKGLVFRLAGVPHAHHDVVRLDWTMHPSDGDTVAGAGSDLLVLDDRRRIRFDYQFEEPMVRG
jgi:hypothetical protein